MATYSGYTQETPKNLLLDAGAFFKNFCTVSDTFTTALAAGKLIGATSGGGSFSAIPEIRAIEIDGVKGVAKGLQVIDSWEVTLSANVKEVSKQSIQLALASSSVDDSTNGSYGIISANNEIQLTDYVDNITWVGRLSGTNDPVIIQVYNALSTGGLTLDVEDKNEATVALTFTGHYDDANLENPPFKIFYPDAIVNTATISPTTFSKGSPADVKITVTTSGNATIGGVRLGTYTLPQYDYSVAGLVLTINKAYLGTLTTGAKVFTVLMDKGNNVTAPSVAVGS